jgi:antitoxin VapB
MPLYIRDDEVDALAVKVQAATGAPTKTEAVRLALRHELERSRERRPLRERLAPAQAAARRIGAADAEFDMKAFTDAMWSED